MKVYSVEYADFGEYEFGYLYLNKEEAEKELQNKQNTSTWHSPKYWTLVEYEVK
jgi:hypothetical protein